MYYKLYYVKIPNLNLMFLKWIRKYIIICIKLFIFNFVASLLSLAVTYRVSVDFLSFPYYNDLVREVMIIKVSLRIAIHFKIDILWLPIEVSFFSKNALISKITSLNYFLVFSIYSPILLLEVLIFRGGRIIRELLYWFELGYTHLRNHS